ncbi:hypothetical protein HY745_11670 [Candidatus Desantisbacteria bacterium]|nr:hypothetical protein [Candidatus Desantisbacteria bacterium]
MGAKQNCWDVKQCGRNPGGAKISLMGVCPASTDITHSNLNNGTNGGRACWLVAGTFCGGKVQGDFAQKKVSCLTCNFFNQVKTEEGTAFVMKK